MNDQTPNSSEIIDKHLDDFFEETDEIVVLNEIETELIHSDIYIIRADENRRFNILLTCGMSDLPMSTTDDNDLFEYAELMMLLPEDWDFDSLNDEKIYWPIRILKELSLIPYPDKTRLGFGHTFENDGEFAEEIGFNSVIIIDSFEMPPEFIKIESEDKVINILSVIPMYKEEFDFKNKFGIEKLLNNFEKFEIEEIVKIGRINTCK